jgi:hypothetical protein
MSLSAKECQMAIGATVVDSIPVVGSTVHTFDKLKDLRYVEYVTVGSMSVPVTLTFRTSSVGNRDRNFGCTLKFDPGLYDPADAVPAGRITVSLNVAASEGDDMTPAAIANYVRYTLGALLQASLIETLRDGGV